MLDEPPDSSALKTLSGHKGAILCCCVYGNNFITAGHDKKIVVWDGISGRIKLEIIGHEHMISDIDIYSGAGCEDAVNEPCILSASWDMSVKVWNMRTGAGICKFTGHKNRVRKVKALLDGVLPEANAGTASVKAISGDDDGVLYVWSVTTGQALLFLDEHTRFITSFAVYHDALGRSRVASASADATIRLWDTAAAVVVGESPVRDTRTSEGGRQRRGVTAPSGSSVCAIRTPSKYISAMVVTTVSAACPLLATGSSGTGSPAGRMLLPPISPTKRAQSGEADQDTNIFEGSGMVAIVIAGDTLGSIFIYRESSGSLLARLEAKCKIIDLFVSSSEANLPYFPTDGDRAQLSATSSPVVFASDAKAGQWESFVSAERAQLLAQAAHVRRSNQILTTLTGAACTSGTEGDLVLHYVPDNGSVGSFTLVPACDGDGEGGHSSLHSVAGSPKHGVLLGGSASSASGGSSGATGAVGAILCSHMVSTALCGQLSAAAASLRNGGDSGRHRTLADTETSAGGASFSGWGGGGGGGRLRREGSVLTQPSTSSRANNNAEDCLATLTLCDKFGNDDSLNLSGNGTPTGSIRKLSTTGTAATERRLPTVSAASASAKLRKHSTYNGSLQADFENDDASVATSSMWSAKESGKDSGKSRGFGSMTQATGSQRGVALGGARGAVMSVSVSSASSHTDYPLLQCFARSTAVGPAGSLRHLVFGTRDGTLMYCTYTAPAPVAVFAQATGDEGSGALAVPTAMAGVRSMPAALTRPPPISTSNKLLPPLKPSPQQQSRSSALHFNPARLSPTSAAQAEAELSASIKASARTRRGVAAAREKVDSHSIRKAALLSSDEDVAMAGAQDSDCYHIGKSDSGDPADAVTQSEVSHLMHYYDDLFCDPTTGTGSSGNSGAGGAGVEDEGDRCQPGAVVEPNLGSMDFREGSANGHAGTCAGADLAAEGVGLCQDSVRSADSGEFASIVSNSTLDPTFWRAANSAKNTYSFRRIRLNQSGRQPVSPSRASALYQLSEVQEDTSHHPQQGPGQDGATRRQYHPQSQSQQLRGSFSATALRDEHSGAALAYSAAAATAGSGAGAGGRRELAGQVGGGVGPTAARQPAPLAQQRPTTTATTAGATLARSASLHSGLARGSPTKSRGGIGASAGAHPPLLLHSATAQNRNIANLSLQL